MNRIKLTLEDGKKVFINMNSVVSIHNSGDISVLMMSRDSSCTVKESVEEVLRLEKEGRIANIVSLKKTI